MRLGTDARMPSTRNSKSSVGRACRKNNGASTVARAVSHDDSMENQNSNHSQDSAKSPRRRKSNVKSVVVLPKRKKTDINAGKDDKMLPHTDLPGRPNEQSDNAVNFTEDGDQVSMEIDDGGQAAKEFASDTEPDADESEIEGSDSDNEERNDQQDSELESQQTDKEDSDLEDQTQTESPANTSLEDNQTIPVNTPMKPKKRRKRMSVEQQLETITDSLHVMQSMMIKKGFYDREPEKNAFLSRGRNRGETSCTSGRKCKSDQREYDTESETTIYKNLLSKGKQSSIEDVDVDFDDLPVQIYVDDPEISFTVKNIRESTSSEDQVDTSDEAIELNELNERFIADCAVEAE